MNKIPAQNLTLRWNWPTRETDMSIPAQGQIRSWNFVLRIGYKWTLCSNLTPAHGTQNIIHFHLSPSITFHYISKINGQRKARHLLTATLQQLIVLHGKRGRYVNALFDQHSQWIKESDQNTATIITVTITDVLIQENGKLQRKRFVEETETGFSERGFFGESSFRDTFLIFSRDDD